LIKKEQQDYVMTKKTTQFRNLLASDRLEFILEAHNGISAKIVEEAGFKGIWGSGLSLSAQYGVRDNNEASWTQVLDMLEFMSDATTIPILLDGDTGYGNFNNMQRLVHKLEQRDIAAVCIEDKLFPKTNSFIKGTAQPLADIEEFCGKIKAGKDAQGDDDFSIIARVEAFIAGWGLKEAMRRAEAYRKAGADAILMHSALSVPDEILAFKKEWGDRLPVVIVPTKYYATPTDQFREAGISIAIWANHMIRTAIASMQKNAATLMAEESLMAIEDSIAPVKEIFRLQGAAELQEAEKRYLPKRGKAVRAVILAASRGKELGELTEKRPKAMVPVSGQPLLAHVVDGYNSVGVKDITVVRGYAKETVNLSNIDYADNDNFESTGELVSLSCALKSLASEDTGKELVVSYGDVLFKKHILQLLLESHADFSIVVDTNWSESVNKGRFADYVQCSRPYGRDAFGQEISLTEMSEHLPEKRTHGEWTGFLKVSADHRLLLGKLVENLTAEDPYARMSDLLNALVANGERVRVIYTTGYWLDIDTLEDVVLAGNLF
jgi:phosphoenolpyruvate phosphomutase